MAKSDFSVIAAQAKKQRGYVPEPETEAQEVRESNPALVPQSVPPSRQGGQHIGAYVDKAVAHQLKEIALRKGTTVQVLICRGLNMVFHEEGMPTIAKEERTPRRR